MLKKILILCLLVITIPAWAVQESYHILKKGEGCYVKSYVNNQFYDVDYKKFWGLKLLARPHRKNKSFMVFRMGEQTYVTKSKCLDTVKVEDWDPELLDSTPEEDYSRYNKVSPYKLETLQVNDQKYMIEIDFGGTNFASKKPVFNDYSMFDGAFSEEGNIQEFAKKATSGKYKGGALFGISFGWRWSDIGFLTFKYKRYSGKKREKVYVTDYLPPPAPNAPPGPVVYSGLKYSEFDDTFNSILFGNKFLFFPSSRLRPTLGLYAGLSTIESKWDALDLKLRSSGFSLQTDVGLELFFTKHFALGVQAGMEFLGTRKFRVVDSDQEVTNRGFTSKMNYTNMFYTGGLKFYF